MQIINVPYIGDDGYEQTKFDEYDLDRLKEAGIEICVYSYGRGYYEGTGNMLVKKDNTWFTRSCGHCSCYGPCENGWSNDLLDLENGASTLEELKKKLSPPLLVEVTPLFKAAEKHNLK